MKYVTTSNPTLTDSRYHSWVMGEAHGAPHASSAGKLKRLVGNDGHIGVAELGELLQTFDEMVAVLQRVTAGRDQLEKEAAERRLIEAALRRNLEELSRANQQLEEFTYVASHDLQEPLRKIQKFCQLLEKDLGASPPDIVRKDLAYITDGAGRMQQLVLDLLAYSRLGRDGIEFSPVALEHVVEWALANLALSIEEKYARIECDTLPEVIGDPALLVELYQNLISNALKYNQGRPEIRVTAAMEDGHWVFGVRDNGIGISPDDAQRIFLPFKRLHRNSEYQGNGIGLAICSKVVELHDGAIWVESSAGRGAHFRFTLTGADS